MKPLVPGYFDHLLEAFRLGRTGRAVHLGLWDEPPAWLAGGVPSPGEFARAQHRMDERVIELGDFSDGQRVLDVACGLGSTLEALAGRFRAMSLHGVNIDRRQLDACRGIRPPTGGTIRWIEADAGRLPLADRSFDRVTCVEAMFHFASRREFFREAARVLAPGGVMIVTDIPLRPGGPPVLLAALAEGYGPWPDTAGRDPDHTVLAREAGLVVTHDLDVTTLTLPSHRFTVPHDIPDDEATLATVGDPGLRAGLALRRLHLRGGLTYRIQRLTKPA